MNRRRWVLLTVLLLALLAGVADETKSAFSVTTANPGNSFAAAASFCSGSISSPEWINGIELGDDAVFSNYALGSSSTDHVTTPVSAGTYALEFIKVSGGSGYVWKSITSSSTVTYATAIRFQTLPAADVAQLMLFDGGGNDAAVGFTKTGGNRLTVRFGAGTAQQSGVISTGTWYVVDIKVVLATNPRTIDWRVNGVAQTQATSSEATSSISTLQYGSTTSGDAYTVYWDDIVVSRSGSDYPVPAGGVLALVPNSVPAISDPSSFMKNDTGTAVSSTSWNRLEEIPTTGNFDDGVKQTGIDASAYIELGFGDVAAGTCVFGVSTWITHNSSATSGANSAKASMFESGTERVVYSGDTQTGGTWVYNKDKAYLPASGTWDATKLNNLTARLGYASDATPNPQWDTVTIQYYTASA